MSETRVVHVKDNVPDAVYIGRPTSRYRLRKSPFANPFVIGKGNIGPALILFAVPPAVTEWTREACVTMYRYLLLYGVGIDIDQVPNLRGKPLACWCRHDGEDKTADALCHGDVLVDVLNQYTDDELREWHPMKRSDMLTPVADAPGELE